MKKEKILVVDDESRMRKLVHDFLNVHGYQVIEAQNGEEALDIFMKDKNNISLIILDIMMPKINGLEVLNLIRDMSAVPVILLTAKSQDSDELIGFEYGADDYITKPFNPKLLVARVENILRRNKKNIEQTLEYGGLVVDKVAHTVKVDGEYVDLSYKEFELLCFFMDNKGIALSREKILNSVWNYDYFGDARTIDTHVKKLRAKLKNKGELIKTIWGMGYKFDE